MKPRFYLIILAVWLWPAFLFSQNVKIGDILCTDGSTISAADFPSSGRTAEGIVFYVDNTGTHGWAVSLNVDALDTDWVTNAHYYDEYDIPDLLNCENSRQALYDMNGYQNTAIIHASHGPDWYPAAWAVDFDNGWYLPAAGQMRWLLSYVNEINESLSVVNGTPFVLPYPDWHWTSTECSSMHAVIVSRLGTISIYMKWNYYSTYTIGVRAIKDFECNSSPEHKIGDVVITPGGQKGIIFYVSPDDGSYWLTALNDLTGSYSWGNDEDIIELDNIVDEMGQWYGMQGIYCGYDATKHIRDAQGNNNAYAANHIDFENGWHIPSTGQLSKIYAALPHIEEALLENGGSLPSGDLYWTCTENSSDKAWAIDFGSDQHLYQEGRFVVTPKQTPCKVRPVWSQSCEIPLPEPTIPDNIIESDCNQPLQGFEWGIREDWSSGSNIYCRIQPLVGDLDDDGIPEIVCFDMEGNSASQTAAKLINVYDGQSKALKAQISVENMVWAHGNGPFGLVKLPNRKGLIVTACKDSKLYAYDIAATNPNNPVWVSNESYNTGYNDFSISIGFADFNGDGYPEIYVRNKIFDAETGVLLATAQGGYNQADSYSHNSHTNHNKLSCPMAYDICGDTRQELILGNEIYDVVITNRNGILGNHATLMKSITPPNNIIADGHVQVADFNLDGHPDILISNRDAEGSYGTVSFYVWDVYNNRTSLPIQLETYFTGKSVPLIADFDNDGFVEILIDCCHESDKGFRGYRFNPATNGFNFLWSLPIDEDSYSNSATLFDFNADGKNELVYTDNRYLRVYDLSTTTPNELSKIDCGEITIMQIPIVADIDNDGSAEIIATGKAGGYLQANTMLKVYKSSTEPWRPARKVWNQYMYHVTNVNEDLTIPTSCFDKATVFTAPDGTIRRPYNNFLQQAGYITPTGEPYNPSDYVEAENYGEGCESYSFHGIIYTESGDYEYLIENPSGCDTLLTVHVNLGDTIHAIQYKNVCTPYTWNGITYNETGIYQQTFTSAQGCDSIVTLYLNVGNQIFDHVTVSTCDSYTLNGIEYTESGLYEQTFISSHGCDSIILLDLTIKASQYVSPIHGESHIYYNENGEFVYSIDPVEGCYGYEWRIDNDWLITASNDSPECVLNINYPAQGTLTVRVYTECGYVERSLTINHDARPWVEVYPNPNDGEFNLGLYGMKGKAIIEVYNYLGQRIDSFNADANIEGTIIPYSLQGKAAGIYILAITHNHNLFTKKVVKTTPALYGVPIW